MLFVFLRDKMLTIVNISLTNYVVPVLGTTIAKMVETEFNNELKGESIIS